MEKENELNTLRQAKKWAEVEALARAELETDPDGVFYLRALEQSLREQKKTAGLFELWKTLIDEHGEDYPYAVWVARELVEREGAARSVDVLRRGIESAIQAKDFDAVEEFWLELIEVMPGELGYFLGLASELEHRREKSRAGELLQLLIPAYELEHPTASVLTLVRRIAELQPRDAGFRAEIQRIYRNFYSGRRDLSLLVQQSGLTGDKPLPESIDLLSRPVR